MCVFLSSVVCRFCLFEKISPFTGRHGLDMHSLRFVEPSKGRFQGVADHEDSNILSWAATLGSLLPMSANSKVSFCVWPFFANRQAHSFPPSSLDRRSAELIVSPKKVVGCRGGNRYFEGGVFKSERFKKMIVPNYQDTTPLKISQKVSALCHTYF